MGNIQHEQVRRLGVQVPEELCSRNYYIYFMKEHEENSWSGTDRWWF